MTPWLGWPLGWAFTTAAVFATGGTAGWTQSPGWHAVAGIALGAAGMFAGAWWSRGRRAAVSYAAAFVLAIGILKLGLLGEGMLSFFLAGGIVGLIGESARRPFDLGRTFRWGAAFAIGAFLVLFPGTYMAHFGGMLAKRITGLQSAVMAGLVLGAAVTGALFGAMATLIGDPED